MECLCRKLTTTGYDEKVVKLRRLVLGLLSVENCTSGEGGMGVVVVDEEGEVVSGTRKGDGGGAM